MLRLIRTKIQSESNSQQCQYGCLCQTVAIDKNENTSAPKGSFREKQFTYIRGKMVQTVNFSIPRSFLIFKEYIPVVYATDTRL